MATLAARARISLFRLLAALLVVLLGSTEAWAQHVAGRFPVGNAADLMVVDPAARQLWTGNGDGTLTVVDGSYPVPVTTTVPLYSAIPTALAVDAVQHLVYVACNDGSLRMIDEADYSNPMPVYLLNAPGGAGSTPGSSQTDGNPLVSLAVDPVAGRVYAVDSNAGIVWICPSGGAGTSSQAKTLGTGPHAIAVNPITGRAYVVDESERTVWSITSSGNGLFALNAHYLGVPCRGIAVDPFTGNVYVANQDSFQVRVLDGTSLGDLATLDLANDPVNLAFNPVNRKVYACGTTRVSIIDTLAGNAVTNVDVDSGPHGITVNPLTGWVYVTNEGSNSLSCLEGSRSYLDGDRIPSTDLGVDGVHYAPGPAAVDPVTGRVYVLQLSTTDSTYVVLAIDGATNRSLLLALGNPSSAVRLDPVLGTFYVAHGTGGTLDTIAGANPTQPPGSLAAGAADALALDPATGRLFLGLETAGTLQIVDPAGSTATTVQVSWADATPPAGSRPERIAVDPVTGRVFVANTAASTVAILDRTSTGALLATAQVGTGPWALAVDPDLRQAYVANSGSGTVSVLRTGDPLAPVRTVTVGAMPRAIAVDPRTHQVLVANWADGTVSAFDGNLGAGPAVVTTVAVGANPSALAVDPDRSLVYVANQGDGTLSILQARDLGATPATVTVDAAPPAVTPADAPLALAVDPLRNKVYVAAGGTGPGPGRVVVVDGITWAVTDTLATGSGTAALAVDPASGLVAAVDGGSPVATLIPPEPYLASGVAIATRLTGASDQDHLPAVRSLLPSFTFTVTNSLGLPAPADLRLLGSDGSLGFPAQGGNPGDNPRTFTATVGNSTFGVHTLYLVPGYGLDGTTATQPVLAGSSPWLGRTATAPYLLLPQSTTLALASDANPAAAGVPVTLTATVTAASAGFEHPGGMVRFYDDSTPPALLAEVALTAGSDPAVSTASFPVAALAAGDHTLTATYEGDPEYGPASQTLAQTINPGSGGGSGGAATLLGVSGSGQSAPVGTAFAQPLTAKASDAQGQPLAGVAVTFSGAGLSFAPPSALTGADGLAATVATPTATGALTATAQAGALSATFNLTGQAGSPVGSAAATVTLTGPAQLKPGDIYTIRVTVTGDGPVPTGRVKLTQSDGTLSFLDLDADGQSALGGRVFGGAPLSYNAHYLGDGHYAPAESAALGIATRKIATETRLAIPTDLTHGQPAKLTASVIATSPGAQLRSNMVLFLANGTEVGRATLNTQWQATVTTTRLPKGDAVVLTAHYLGSSDSLESTSQDAPVRVAPGLLLERSGMADPSIQAGEVASFLLSLDTRDLEPGQVVTLRVSGLPSGGTATFTPATFTAGPDVLKVRMEVATTARYSYSWQLPGGQPNQPQASHPGATGSGHRMATFSGAPMGFLGGGLLVGCLLVWGLSTLPMGRRRRRILVLLAALALGSLGGLPGCIEKHTNASYTEGGGYPLTVQASAQGVGSGTVVVYLNVVEPVF